MKEAGGMAMPKDEPNAIGVEPGQTKELTFTFDEPGTTLAGCHVVGHYAGRHEGDDHRRVNIVARLLRSSSWSFLRSWLAVT